MPAYALDSFGPEPAGPVSAAGIRGVIRYLAPVNPQTAPKITTLTEVAADRAAGLDITLNWEWFEGRPFVGFLAGQQDAVSADAQADALGYPRGCAIYYSVDTAAQWAQVEPYFRGIHAISKRPVGIYGGLPLWNAARAAGYVQYGWLTNAASWSGLSSWAALATAARTSGAHLLQHLHDGTVLVPGVNPASFDANEILNPAYGQWPAHNQGAFMALSDTQQQQMYDAIMEMDKNLMQGIGHSLVNDAINEAKAAHAGADQTVVAEKAVQAALAKLSPTAAATIDTGALSAAIAANLSARLQS